MSFSVPYMVLLEPQSDTVVFSSKDPFQNWNNDTEVRSFDNTAGIRKAIAEINADCTANASLSIGMESAKLATITIAGSPDTVIAHRLKILQHCYEIGVDHVGIDAFHLFDKQGHLSEFLRQHLNEVARYTTATIFITKNLNTSLQPQNPSALKPENLWKPYHILAYGDLDSIAFAKTRTALLIDELNGLFIDRLSVPLSSHPLLAGRNQAYFQKVTQDTGTKLYTPTLFPGVHSSIDEQHARRDYDEIYIVGQESDVDSAKDMIQDLISKILVFRKDFVIQFAKIDFLLLHCLDKLEDLARQNAAFIQFPHLGAAESVVRIQCSSHIFVENTIRSVAKLTCDVYTASYWIHDSRADDQGFLLPPTIHPSSKAIIEVLSQISSSSDSDISYLNGSFEVVGGVDAIKSAISQIRGLSFWPNCNHQVRFRLELSVDQKEFIAGKKNGKINRIMNTAHVWVKFEPFNEYNFFVDLVASNYASALFGLQLFEEELPAELSFFIPESYHRSIIGSGGHQIQMLMRKYNVFVKFSNSYDQSSDLGAASTIDNVVVRCPAKNAENLKPVQQEIADMVSKIEQNGSIDQAPQTTKPTYVYNALPTVPQTPIAYSARRR
ncbi:hypothetical protein V1512DRAFT_269993 [Lipomyces arxii]|uniref:uncharacterized protein n=1 Tax=Lipomyces arxii TaxID=56418 RepID=UPI0034CEF650